MNTDLPYILSHTVDIPHKDDYQSHLHNQYEILYFIKGAVRYRIENTVYPLSPGDLLLIRPRMFHCLLPIEPKEYERYVLHFSAEEVPPCLHDTLNAAAEIHTFPIGSSMYRRFRRVADMRHLLTEEEFRLLLDGLLSEFLLNIKYRPSNPAAVPVQLKDTMAEILAEIDRRPQDICSVNALLDKYYVSRSWLEHRFRTELGMTPLQFIEKKRILYAQSLILGGLSPTLAARQCHYGDYVTFYRNYKKILHHTPKADKQEQK